jgi:GxxExxY protein
MATPPVNKNLVYPELTERILESLHRVHFTLGPGFIHRVYRESVMIDLQLQSINYNLINEIPYYFDDDYIDTLETQMIKVENKILLGVFALEFVDDTMIEVMTTRMAHLKTTVGFLAKFYGERLQVERIYSTPYSNAASVSSTSSTAD